MSELLVENFRPYPDVILNPPPVACLSQESIDASLRALKDPMQFPTDYMRTLLTESSLSIDELTHRRHVHKMSGDMYLVMGRGTKDLWAAAVLIRGKDGVWRVYLPTDTYYFELLRQALRYGARSCDVVTLITWVYGNTGLDVDDGFADLIATVVWQNFGYCDELVREFIRCCIHNVLEHLYYGFVAENYYIILPPEHKPIIPNEDRPASMFGPAIKYDALLTMLSCSDLTFEDVGCITNDSRGNGRGVRNHIVERGIALPRNILLSGVCFSEFVIVPDGQKRSGRGIGMSLLDENEHRLKAWWDGLVASGVSDDFGRCLDNRLERYKGISLGTWKRI